MTNKSLSLAVVGHTNTGKTSLLRTLLRDSTFGEVKNASATTRHVEQAVISDGIEPLVHLYDTPGLEDAGGVLDWLENNTSTRLDGIERIQQFLASEAAANEFNQEAKVLKQMLQSDMALYVADAREPMLNKYRDELTVLSWSAKPVMPVFNFLEGQDLSEWQTMLARRTLHIYSGFDTVAFDFESEIRLWDNLAAMLPKRGILDNLIDMRQHEWQQLQQNALQEIAGFLLDVAAYRQESDEESDDEPVLRAMQEQVRQLERKMQQRLFHLYRFYRSEIGSSDWTLKAFEQDPFDSETLMQYGIRTGTGAAAGALIGLGIDIATLGGSLGLGTAIGGLLGGVLPNMHDISDKISGKKTLYIDSETLALLAARSLNLLYVLKKRGHAAQTQIQLQQQNAPWQPDKLPSELNKARSQWKWSSLNTQLPELSHAERQKAANSLQQKLAQHLG